MLAGYGPYGWLTVRLLFWPWLAFFVFVFVVNLVSPESDWSVFQLAAGALIPTAVCALVIAPSGVSTWRSEVCVGCRHERGKHKRSVECTALDSDGFSTCPCEEFT